MREEKDNPLRVLKTGETYLQASTRVRTYGVLVWQECRRRVKQVMRERRLNQTGAEDVVLGEEYTAERLPLLPKVGVIAVDIPWEEGRADVEAAKNDFDWVLAALHVKLPKGVGKPYLRRYLEHLRASKTLSDRFLSSVTVRLAGVAGDSPAPETGPGPEDETIEQIVRRGRNGQATATLP